MIALFPALCYNTKKRRGAADVWDAILAWTWCLPQNLAGAALWALCRGKRYDYRRARVTVWRRKASLSLGRYIFLTDDPLFYYPEQRTAFSPETFARRLLVHEYGHTVQSRILGPLYLALVGIPSLVWSFSPRATRRRERERISYFSAYPERWANRLGERCTGEPSIGEPVS